jgi:glycosyltransferase involved in cell wall biosynthesis
MASILLLSRYERMGPSSRVRHYNYVPALERAGFDVTISPLLDSDYLKRLYSGERQSPRAMLKAYWRRLCQLRTARQFDLIWIEKEVLPWMPAALERSLFGGRPVVIDFDDAWYLRYASHRNWLVRAALGRKFDGLVSHAKTVTAGNPTLMKWALGAHAPHVVQIPSVVDVDRYPVLPLPAGPFTIGWIGTPSNSPNLARISEPLRHLQRVCGARLRVIGADQFNIPGLEIDHVAWREETEAMELAACHVGITPLLDGAWERGKCGYKSIQYMAAGRPVVASPVGANSSIIEAGKTGFFAGCPEDWISALTGLAADRERNRKLGLAARQRAETKYSLQSSAATLIEVLKFALLDLPPEKAATAQWCGLSTTMAASGRPASPSRPLACAGTGRLCYFALDVPHRGQASFIHITEIVKNLREQRWQVDLYAPVPLENGEQPTLIWRLLAHAQVILRTILRLRNYDAIYIRSHFFAWPVTLAAGWKGLVILQEVNGTYRDVVVSYPWLKPVAGLIAWLYRWQWRRSEHVLPVTRELAEWLRGEGVQCPITVVSNAANTALFRPLARTAVTPFVVFFGGLTQWYGVDLMVDAVRHPAWPAGVEIIVIGRGSKQSEIITAQKAGAPIRWLGYRPNQEIPELIASAIAGLVPTTNPSGRSSTGVLPLKLYEILACGLPAIVTDLPGQADLVRDGRCGLVIAADAAALALAVAYLHRHPEEAKAMGERGADLVKSAHSWAARATQVDAILTTCLQESSRELARLRAGTASRARMRSLWH